MITGHKLSHKENLDGPSHLCRHAGRSWRRPSLFSRITTAQTSLKTKNVVFVHGLFADGSCWSKVIARLQKKGVNCTSVQNPLTSLQEASDAARRAIAAQPP